ncbi:MAG: inorganic phosphate transporter [Muribaculaceae bacterium]|nr:inorganic phosphate transporter [Muribaculaceae bacterium]
MEPIFIVIVVILALLAVLDLIVGVANDAINFLNAALGAKVAPHNVILFVAAAGIIVGVLTSSGMMEVARNGVFYPGQFTFAEIMVLFVGVMLADVVLLNTFNSLGLPTSTTVSLVFELLGSAVAIALYKIATDSGLTINDLGDFINSGKAMVIISGILVSVVIAFTVGGVLMYISRLIFTFRYNKMFSRLGAMWCGISLTGIIYFALFKGLKSSGLVPIELTSFINENTMTALLGIWVVCSALLALLQYLKVNILKFTILAGTFALALAFAGNDLVNFIGISFAGFDSFKLAMDSGDISMKMDALAAPAHVNLWLLIGAGVIMVITLFFSRDAMKVAQTQLDLSSQQENEERFSTSVLSRNIVRLAVKFNATYNKLMPISAQEWINNRFTPLSEEERGNASYDLIRAAVNLTAASILICLGTSLKLPLSTTYVVFMVAMGSSLADRAWGRDSAVYRITGVLVVISGWFMTAIAGFTISFLVGLFLIWGGWIALTIVSLLCGCALLQQFIFKAKAKKEDSLTIKHDADDADALYSCTETVCTTMREISDIYNHMLVALFTENRKALKETVQQSEVLYHDANKRKYEIMMTIKKLQDQKIETAHFYVQVVDYITEVTKALLHCTRPAYEHIDNNHKGFTEEQIVDLKLINDEVENIFNVVNEMLTNKDFSRLDDVLVMRDALFEIMAERIKNQIRRIKAGEASTRASALYFNILNETKTMILQSRNLLKSQAHFLANIN